MPRGGKFFPSDSQSPPAFPTLPPPGPPGRSSASAARDRQRPNNDAGGEGKFASPRGAGAHRGPHRRRPHRPSPRLRDSLLPAPRDRNSQGAPPLPRASGLRRPRTAGPPAAGSGPGSPTSRQRTGREGRQEGAPEGTAATVMALNSCPSRAAAEPGRQPPPPHPRLQRPPAPSRPPGAARVG